MRNKQAFTLAEVLITLGVIGVVAAITLPSFMENVTERINSERQANIAQKVTQAMEQMRAHGLLNTQYQSTDAFVDELQKYLKIAKRCDSSHVAECWPTKKVTTSDGEEFEVSKAKTGKNLSLSTETNNVGLILADGASIILNYNPATQGLDVGDRVEAKPKSLPVGFGKSKDFAYTSDVTNGIDFVMDVNGGKSPNSEVDGRARDIRSFTIAKFSSGCAGFEVPDVGCVVNIGKNYDPETDLSKTPLANTIDCKMYGGDFCKDYWLGAQNKCRSMKMHLTTREELRYICLQQDNISDIPTDTFVSSEEYSTILVWTKSLSSGNCHNTTTIHNYGEGYSCYKRTQYNAMCVSN
ncbi:type II secretion system protein [bacterium]|nr:type II secretion system protein [bacterium]